MDVTVSSSARHMSRFLSGRVVRLRESPDNPIAAAMWHVVRAITLSPRSEELTGVVKPDRWYLDWWL
jgi:hypothetical protein